MTHYPSLKDWHIALGRADDRTRKELIIDLGRNLHTIGNTEEPAPIEKPITENTRYITRLKSGPAWLHQAPDTKAKRALFDSLEAGSIRIGLPPR